MSEPLGGPNVRIDGTRVYLRRVRQDDVAGRYHAWMNDPEITRYLESRFTSYSEQALREYVAAREQDPSTLFLAIVRKDTDEHIGNIKIGPIDRHHGLGDIGIIVGEKSAWGHGFATDAIAALSRYAFETLGLRKLTAGCYGPNTGSVRAFEKAGFVVEGVRPRQYVCDEQTVDGILLGRLREDSPSR